MTISTTIDTHGVTQEQMSAASRIIGPDGHVFYLVESAHEVGLEYRVAAIRVGHEWHVTCTCKAGQNGTPCWHKRAAAAHAEEYKAAVHLAARRDAEADTAKLDKIRRLVEAGLTHSQALLASDNHESVSDDELVRVYGKPAKKVTGKGRTDLKTFSLMR